jgi:endonuclease/exonuclease/phosphatase family metal-dependent hydrolase
MGTYKVMFWNIQNLYDFKAAMPGEYELAEESRPTKKRRKEDGTEKLYVRNGINYRQLVAGTIWKNDPDIMVIVELSVGRKELEIAGRAQGSSVYYDHFAVFNLMVELNQFYAAMTNTATLWESAQSRVNASDMVAMAAAAGVSIAKTKNTMFEQYAVMWKKTKFSAVPIQVQGQPRVEIATLNQDTAGLRLPFAQRDPGGIRLTEIGNPQNDLYVVMNHSVWGDVDAERLRTIGYLARLNEIINEKNLLVAGDFNVHWGTTGAAYAPLVQLVPHVRNGPGLTSSVASKNKALTNAYDQIFTKAAVTPAQSTGGPYDFVSTVCNENWDKARLLSDHLPVTANITLP